jgi:WD40 repeat protein
MNVARRVPAFWGVAGSSHALQDRGDLALVRTSDWGEVLRIVDAHEQNVDVAFSRDAQTPFSTGDGRVTAWSTTGSTERRDLMNDLAFVGSTVEVSPDGTLLVAGAVSGELRVWSLPDSDATAGAGGESGSSASGGAGGAAATLPEPVPEGSLPSHGSTIVATRFSPDSRQLAVAYSDYTVWVWCRE